MIITKIMGGVLFALCIWYILILYKNNRNKF
jgi:hypothetical protein